MAVLIERTKKEEKEYNKQVKREAFLKKLTLLKSKLLKKKLDPKDTRTVQAHPDKQGRMRDYYISSPYLQNGESFEAVVPIMEDEENKRYVYSGIILGAKNASGVIEFDAPISEIMANPNANVKFQEIISKANALKICLEYYQKIGIQVSPEESLFAKPKFVLGSLKKDKNGEYEYSTSIDEDIEKKLEEERENQKQAELLIDENSAEINLGDGLVVARQNCWMDQDGVNIKFAGTNIEALYYEFSPGKPIKTDDGKYVYIGKLQLGENKVVNQGPDKPIQFVNSLQFDDVVIWTEGQSLIQYFLDHKFDGLNFALGEMITIGKAKRDSDDKQESKEHQKGKILGGITIDAEGKCKTIEETPESVLDAVEDYLNADKQNNTISFDDISK